jgi:parvulin-like peptidyl-prolyl isomerase
MAAYHEQVNYTRQVAIYNGDIDQCQHGSPAALCNQLKTSALTDLIDNELVQEYATKHRISVPNADFNREWAQIYKGRFGSNKTLLTAFAKRMGITVSDLQARVREDMLRQGVVARVAGNIPTRVPALRVAGIFVPQAKQSRQVQAELKAGKPFMTVVQSLSGKGGPCAASGSCGDSGWTPDALVSPYQRFLLKEPVGVPLGPYRLQQGFQYYLVEAKSPRYQLTPGQEVEMRGLVFSKWLAQQERRANVKRYVAT